MPADLQTNLARQHATILAKPFQVDVPLVTVRGVGALQVAVPSPVRDTRQD
jgi:hypothetical protein